MRRVFGLLCFIPFILSAQEPAEQQLENRHEEQATEDDSYLVQLEQYRKDRLSLNDADAAVLNELGILTDLQIESFLHYRRLFGKLVNVYELQAVPSWDLPTIRKLLPFITVHDNDLLTQQLAKRFRKGEHSMLVRMSQALGEQNGSYQGSRQRVLLRYRYNYKNVLQYGVVAEKDAGEQFQRGFDFYSVHFFATRIGAIRALALGDFSVNMGQGLLQWQGFAFQKSAEVMMIKRQLPLLRPHTGAGEFYFHRGAGIIMSKGKWTAGAFISMRKIDANIVIDSLNVRFVSSLLSSGYHRTAAEIADRNSLSQLAAGSSIGYLGKRWHLNINGVYYHLSTPLRKSDEPYDLFAIEGNSWYNAGVDYGFTHKNIHVFGEAAIDKKMAAAFLNGVLISVDAKVDLSFLQRMIARHYQAMYANAFMENTRPSNETGYYAGITIRPFPAWKLDGYADLFSCPWLKYTTDAPGSGTDMLVRLTFTPNRQTEIYTRFRYQCKPVNEPGTATATHRLYYPRQQHWRTQVNFKLNSAASIRSRVELSWYGTGGERARARGFLAYTDVLYKPMLRRWSLVFRCMYVETDDYNSRIYAYENDVLYSYTVPAFSGAGFRYYSVVQYDLTKRISLWLRWAQLIVVHSLQPVNDVVLSRAEIKWQLRYSW